MIENEAQKEITQEWIKKFESEMNIILADPEIDDVIKQMYKNSYLSLIDGLKAELEDYERLTEWDNVKIPYEEPFDVELYDEMMLLGTYEPDWK